MPSRFEVTAVGEMLLRLSVPAGDRLESASGLAVNPAGAEGNVLAALARLGHRCGLVSSLPASALGRLVANPLRMAGVDLQGIVWTEGGRVGTYFVEFARAPRPTQVIYDRADSAFARLEARQVDWDYLLDTRLVHLTGITPALSPNCHALVEETIHRARAARVPISLDVNYRRTLWPPSQASASLNRLMQGVDLLFCGRRDAETLFGCDGPPEQVAQTLAERSGARVVVVTLGADGAIAWDGTRFVQERALAVEMIDRLGAGDAFAAGVLHGWLQGELTLGLRVGTLLAALALTQRGDLLVTSEAEVDALLANREADVAR